MKTSFFKLLALPALMAMISIACGFSSGAGPESGTATVAAGQQATQTPASPYFQEDFNGGLDNWSHFVVDGSKTSVGGNPQLVQKDFGTMTFGIKDGFLVFDLESPGQWIYSTYDAQDYDDVRVDVSAENRGTNSNNVSLLCRYTADQGWYEFNVANSGLYNIYYASVSSDKTVVYSKLADGGSNKIKSGTATNQYAIVCQGHTLSLYINTIHVRSFDDNQYGLKKGKVGVSVSSFTDLPAIVGFDWVKISQP
jgi:hypothetical protein